MIPSEFVSSVFSTTDINQIAWQDIKRAETESNRNFQLIRAPTVVSGNLGYPMLSATYVMNGYVNEVTFCDCKYTVDIIRSSGYPDSFDSYYPSYGSWIISTIQVDTSKLPQFQAMANEVEQSYQDALNSGVDAFAESMSNIGKPTPLDEYYEEKRNCIEMEMLGC